MPDENPIEKPCDRCAFDGNHDCVCAACKEAGWDYLEPYVVAPLNPDIMIKLEALDNA